jgi:hypothetical protein
MDPRPLTVSLLFTACSLCAQITTSQVDNARTNANPHETILTPSNVNARQFGKLFSFPVDGDVYAQPLYLPRVQIPGKGTHNVLFVATEHDSVYAFDADGASREPLWQVNFLKQEPGTSTVPADDVSCPFIQPEIGITPTPVIDLQSGTIYILARTKKSGVISGAHYFHKLHALAITTGAEKYGGPIEVQTKGFDGLRELPRAGLTLANGQVILTWASSCDEGPYHGWVMSYDARSLKQTGVLNTSPDAGQSGIWQSDMAPAADGAGNVYLSTGNGKFNVSGNARDYGDSVLKLGFQSGAVAVLDYFTPSNQEALNARDGDLGSGGVILLPDQPGTHLHLLIAAGKNGVLYLLDRDHLGQYQTGGNAPAVQTLRLGDGFYSAPAYWNGHVYALGSDDFLADFVLEQGRLPDQFAGRGQQKFANPGATPAVSANGNKDGIVWLIETKVWNDFGNRPAVLHAYDAHSIGRELYNSEENKSRDRAGSAVRFAVPSIANGRVYIGLKSEVDVYGLLTRR